MRIRTLLLISAIMSAPAFAQQVQRSSNPHGIQILGNTEIQAQQQSTAVAAQGESNTAKNTSGAIKAGTQIQGNTRIKASQTNSTAISQGKNNASANEAGVIGGK